MTPAEAQSFLDENFAPWVLALSPGVLAVGPGSVTLRIPLGPQIARVGGIASGQALATLADTAMVLACGAGIGEFLPVSTTNLDVQFLRPATGEAVRAEAEVVRAGRAMIFARATLIAEPAEKPVATASATFFRPS